MKKIALKTHRAFFPSQHNNYQPFVLRPRNLLTLILVLLLIKILIASWFFYFPKTTQFASIASFELIELVNRERKANGLSPLKINEKLIQAAQEKAQDMLLKGYFAHISPEGITPWYWFEKVGYNYEAAGENLARDFTDSEILLQAWMNSPSHRSNILNKNYQEIGIAVVEGKMKGRKTILVVQLFGKESSKSEEKPTVLAKVSPSPTPLPLALKQQKQNELKETPLPTLTPSLIQEATPLIEGISEEEVTIQEIKTPSPKSLVFFNNLAKKLDVLVKNIYFIIAGFLIFILLLTVFINIRVQYPKLISFALVAIFVIIGLSAFNVHLFLSREMDIFTGAMILR